MKDAAIFRPYRRACASHALIIAEGNAALRLRMNLAMECPCLRNPRRLFMHVVVYLGPSTKPCNRTRGFVNVDPPRVSTLLRSMSAFLARGPRPAGPPLF
jgi:hypothetical protein